MKFLTAILLAGGCLAQTLAPVFSACLIDGSLARTKIMPHGSFEPNDGHPVLTIQPGKNKSCSAWGSWADTVDTEGWGYLTIESNAGHSDSIQAFAAGWLEGSLTQERMYQSVTSNYYQAFGNRSTPVSLSTYLETNTEWMKAQLNSNPTDPFWLHIGYVMLQVEGLTGGYQSVQPPDQQLQYFDVQFMQLFGDLINLLPAVDPSLRITLEQYLQMSESELLATIRPSQHCSSLTRFVPQQSELFVAHTTWSTFCMMLRIYKTYALHYSTSASETIQFSSYPGCVQSVDDFYQLIEQRMVVTETTNSIYNTSLFDAIVPEMLLTWPRIVATNQLATNTDTWIQFMSHNVAGTYSNQWIVADYKLMDQNTQQLAPKTVQIMEEIPAYWESMDVSQFINHYGAWKSFNIPFFMG